MHQIGITNDPDRRVTLHEAKNWQLVELIGPIIGKRARELEATVLAQLWRQEIWTGKRAGLKKFDGYTESWQSSQFSPNSISEIINVEIFLKSDE